MDDVKVNVRIRDDYGNVYTVSSNSSPGEAALGGIVASAGLLVLLIYAALILL